MTIPLKSIKHLPEDKLEQSELRNGFDCELVEEYPIEVHCPVCLAIMRDPQQVTCCGKNFCEVCIKRVKTNGKPCPTCKNNFEYFADKRLRQSMYGLKVRCLYRKDGCEWVGELGQFDKHLNLDPEQDKQLEGCGHCNIKCQYCAKSFQRHNLLSHQNDQCLKRPFICEHCNDYQSDFDDVTNNHWPVCGSYPAQCPNACGATLKRTEVDSHLAVYCPLTIIECSHVSVGCEIKLLRKDMSVHESEAVNKHRVLLLTRMRDSDEELKKLKNEISAIKCELQEQRCENIELVRRLEEATSLPTMAIPFSPPGLILGEAELDCNSLDHCALPFYTHQRGYRMRFKIRIEKSIKFEVKGREISVLVNVMRGEFDSQLKWPLRAKLTVQLVNCKSGDENYTWVVCYDDEAEFLSSNRVTTQKLAPKPVRVNKFISKRELQQICRENNGLEFRVSKVVFK